MKIKTVSAKGLNSCSVGSFQVSVVRGRNILYCYTDIKRSFCKSVLVCELCYGDAGIQKVYIQKCALCLCSFVYICVDVLILQIPY